MEIAVMNYLIKIGKYFFDKHYVKSIYFSREVGKPQRYIIIQWIEFEKKKCSELLNLVVRLVFP